VSSQAGLALVIFLFTYVLISARRLHFLPIGRTASALLGATLMVVLGIVTPEQAYTRAVDGNTIVLLLGMMIITEHLELAGFFNWSAGFAFRVARSPRSLLVWLAWTAGILSALFVNDTVCLLMTPLIVQILRQTQLPRFPYLMALATASNIGSVMTLVGNPQNMIIGSLAAKDGLDYLTFAMYMIPVGIVCLAVHVVFLLWMFRRQLPASWDNRAVPAVALDRPLLTRTLLIVLGVCIAFCLRLNPAWAALAGACLLFVSNGKKPSAPDVLARIDWSLLLFFAALFITVYGLDVSGVKDLFWQYAGGLWDTGPLLQRLHFVWVSVLGSNLVSNVPFIKLIEGQMGNFGTTAAELREMWMLLAMATTFAGNLTLLGSVANIIVMESSGEPVGFWQYLYVGFPATVISCVLGTALLLFLTRL
jgi:Na+/H+ antiporter NhaD/arsenite permease-like protein